MYVCMCVCVYIHTHTHTHTHMHVIEIRGGIEFTRTPLFRDNK